MKNGWRYSVYIHYNNDESEAILLKPIKFLLGKNVLTNRGSFGWLRTHMVYVVVSWNYLCLDVQQLLAEHSSVPELLKAGIVYHNM